MTRRGRFPLLMAAALATGGTLLLAWIFTTPVPPLLAAEPAVRSFAPRRTTPAPTSGTLQREREGTTLVDVPGYFKLTGDRATFFPSRGDVHYLALENLNLERIAIAISDIPEQLPWIVSGTVTEYRGANYLLVTKAILQNAPATPARPVSNSSEPVGLPRSTPAF
jgi:hypothetical protein